MGKLVRFGVSMDEGLLAKFDELIVDQGYENRSEAIRDLVKRALVDQGYEEGEEQIAGTITLIYPYGLKLKAVPTDPHPSVEVLANLQVHLDKETCLKVLVVRGQARYVADWANELLGMKGVLGQFTLSGTSDITGFR